MQGTSERAVLTIVFCFSILVISAQSYDFGSCPKLLDPVGIHPSSGQVIKAGRFDVTKNADEIVVTTICDESLGWILADTRFKEVRCSNDERRRVWSWSHQHRSQITPPQIRCASFSPKPLEQSYTLHNYQGCSSADIRASLTSQVAAQLEKELPCVVSKECVVPSVRCRGEGTSSKLSVVVEPTMLGSLEQQKQMLEDAAQFLRDTFKPVFSSGGISKRDADPNPFPDGDPDDSTTTDCLDGQKTMKINDTCVDCTAGTFANKTDPNNEICEPCDYDSYSENKTNSQCTHCAAQKGTLTPGSDSKDDCTDICEVPQVDYTSLMEPAAGGRVLEGEVVTLHCNQGFYYGNMAASEVTCNDDKDNNNNFPASCRGITVKTEKTSIKEGSDMSLTCVVNTTGTIPKFTWYKAPVDKPDQTKKLLIDGVFLWSSPVFNITSFNGDDNGHYYCQPEYKEPILDDLSKPVTLSVLDVKMNPVERTHAYVGYQVNFTCTMRIDPSYPKRTIEWTKNTTKEKITTGMTTSQTDQFYHSVLTLSDLNLEDTDIYKCSGTYTNTVGNETVSLAEQVEVTVRGFVKQLENVSVLVGKDFRLDCEFFVGSDIGRNDDESELSWKRYENGYWADINNDTRFTITKEFNDTTSYPLLL
ncbi:uncharacterized protein LOC134820274 [Bolinopsis microptera]|uniref:uncharacterized protein LOC134820274 n=1 Tax=Bolinopsis microptera TaxID=2820187 RepID=UPI00307A219F